MNRYEQMDATAELGSSAALRKKTVTVVGLGSIGSAAAEMLARMGVNLRIIDRDRVHKEDLHHLSLFSEDHISKFKAKEAKKILEGINKDITVKAFHEDMVEHNAYLAESDVVIECSNDLGTALLVDKAVKKTPIIYARSVGVEGHIIAVDDVRVAQYKDYLDKLHPDAKSPILGSTSKMVACVAVNKALQVLSGQKVEKNCLEINSWKYSMNKATPRKSAKK